MKYTCKDTFFCLGLIFLVIVHFSGCGNKINQPENIDYATSEWIDAWLHHPVLGDPSFDTFERSLNNPIHQGSYPLEWPVNGFLFKDPVSAHWFLFIGNYSRRYAMGPDKAMICTVYQSKDKGLNWQYLGPVFTDGPFYFKGDSMPASYAPDVSIVYDEERYHMAYDWATDDADWNTIRLLGKSGIGYAWSEKPEGPYHRTKEPLIRNGEYYADTILQKYNRFYGLTLLRRANDWLLLSLIDAGNYFGWGLAGSTAEKAQGPYGDPIPIFHMEENQYHPPLMEYYPAFVHENWIYAPATSVALNRNFQIIHRVPIEKAMVPQAWEIYQHGSVWHSIDVPHESYGIWGQTITGFVDDNNRFNVMFPSKNSNDIGTINIATRLWNRPYRKHGFNMSGHRGPSMTLVKRFYKNFKLKTKFNSEGLITFFWAYNEPLGADKPKSEASIHRLSIPKEVGLEIGQDSLKLFVTNKQGHKNILASEKIWEKAPRELIIDNNLGDTLSVILDNKVIWKGITISRKGAIGVLVGQNSYLSVDRFLISGSPYMAILPMLYTEALLGAGQSLNDWQVKTSEQFRYNCGAVHKENGGRAKWNFHGKGFSIWAPKGPDFGKIVISVDGNHRGDIDLYAVSEVISRPVFTLDKLVSGFHAVVLEGTGGRLVIDSIDVLH
jgi:hypothetical protein